MESVSSQVVAATKLPVLNPGKFELWKMRIKRYFLMTDYALWEVILNGDSPLPIRTVDGVETSVPPTTVEQKLARKNELKARGTLTKLIEQTYERLQKLISQLEMHDEVIPQEDINQKFLRSLSQEWTMHTIVWRNKPEVETMSLDNLFNNLKAYESELWFNILALRSSDSSTTLKLGDVVIFSFFASPNPRWTLFYADYEGWEIPLKYTWEKLDMVNKEIIRFYKSKCDGFGYDWSDQAEEGPTNFDLMAYSSTSLSSSTNSKDKVVSYKTRLESVEARLLVFKKNESVYEEDIKLLKSEIYLSDLDIKELQRKLELATKEKDEVPLTVQNFKNSSKSLSKLLDIQIMDKCKTGLGYNAVLPPYTRNFMPPKPDLVYHSIDDFVDVNESVVEKPIVETNEPKEVRKENDTLIIEDWVSDSDEEDVPKVKTVKMFNKPSFAKINLVKSTKQIKSPRKTSVNKNRQNTPSPRGNKRNWNQHMSQRLGSNFEIINKACHVCGSFDHLKNDYNKWCNNGRFAKPGNPQQDLKDKGVIDSGCSRHMTRNKSYLIDYEEIDGGFVAFGGNSKGGKITGKGKIRTGKLDFKDVYFVKELKFNLFSVSQMCDKKNSVLFTDTECVVLSPDFKLTDESHVLLKVPRKDNMYSVDLKNVVPQGGLTCLFTKATSDESNL
ncbi:hypothetical protein Tco_0196516 [Tanacetum coccineum]